jgi:general secretion pathway protein C
MVKGRAMHGLSSFALVACLAMTVLVDAWKAEAQCESPGRPNLHDTRPDSRSAGDEPMARTTNTMGSPVAGHPLDFRLVGTVVADTPGRSLAVVESPSTGEQRGYLVGDQVGGITIKEILRGKVVIQTPSGNAVLSLKSKGGTEASITPPKTIPPVVAHLDKEEFDAVLPNYTHLMREICMRPRFNGGRPKGFVIYNISPESILNRMGLKDGDLIMGVNGTSFATTQPVVEFYEALKAGEAASFQFERDGEAQQLHIEFTD